MYTPTQRTHTDTHTQIISNTLYERCMICVYFGLRTAYIF